MGFVRKHLSADGLIATARHEFNKENFKKSNYNSYSLQDCLMSGLAIFGFKFPSLLQFERGKETDAVLRRNLRGLYGVKQAPSDTSLRERLDAVSPRQLRRPFKAIFADLQRGKALERYRYLEGHYIISIDGTGQYTSSKVSCKNCCLKKHRTGDTTYYHQMLGAALVHPDEKVVIPFAPEPIVNGHGSNKNDCERNASKRLLQDLRREHPHLKMLIVEDALAGNYPHVQWLDSLDMSYVIGVKKGSHELLFSWIDALSGKHIKRTDAKKEHNFYIYEDVPLNDQHHDYRVNVLHYTETSGGRTRQFTWITRLSLTEDNVYDVMRAGRSRWKIENETFNTLKNQGYNFSHNYGHGYDQLCSVMSTLMVLSFLIDQVQQLCCKSYQKARELRGSLRSLFEFLRPLLQLFAWDSFAQVWDFIGNPNDRSPPSALMDPS